MDVCVVDGQDNMFDVSWDLSLPLSAFDSALNLELDPLDPSILPLPYEGEQGDIHMDIDDPVRLSPLSLPS